METMQPVFNCTCGALIEADRVDMFDAHGVPLDEGTPYGHGYCRDCGRPVAGSLVDPPRLHDLIWTVRFYLPSGTHHQTVTLCAPSKSVALSRAGATDPDAAKGAGEVRASQATWFDCVQAFGRVTADRIFNANK